ncbi:hypothetical protein ACFX13_027351 [Malus domestica]
MGDISTVECKNVMFTNPSVFSERWKTKPNAINSPVGKVCVGQQGQQGSGEGRTSHYNQRSRNPSALSGADSHLSPPKLPERPIFAALHLHACISWRDFGANFAAILKAY